VPPAPRLRRRVGLVLALAYIAALLLVIGCLRFVGEAWWLTTGALYLPRLGFALPLPLVLVAIAATNPRQLTWFAPLSLWLLVHPLMGLNLGTAFAPGVAQAAHAPLRVLSYNVQSAREPDVIADTVARAEADLVLFQEWDDRAAEALFTVLPGYHRFVSGQFAVFSRFPISEIYVPPRVAAGPQRDRAARFVRYTIAAPFGATAVLNVHPVSPRAGLEEVRRSELARDLLEGNVAPPEGIESLRTNAALRWRQAEAIAEEALHAAEATGGRVIIAGDTNLPGLSRIFAQTLASFHDGFTQAGRGFGYTFPTHRPWMRIDRILASAPLGFTRFAVLPDAGSDHLAVTADLIAY
jgi:vancomycin resistance protein VanJ